MLRNLIARLSRLIHLPRADEQRIAKRMEQYTGVDMPVAYKIEPRHVHGELYTYKIRHDHTDRRN